MSFESLRTALTQMPTTGPLGFEGLITGLLSALTEDRFVLARSGDQPADAASISSEIAVQAKRYDRTPLDETEFEGDFSKACREYPTLDCYVFAATRTTAQLENLARVLERQTGVDILLIGYGSADSELPALCVSFWECLNNFPALKGAYVELHSWAANEAKHAEIQATVQRLRVTLTESLPVLTTVRRKVERFLKSRFGLTPHSSRPSRFRIDLCESIKRETHIKTLSNWWDQRKEPVALLQGEEGNGKSWVGAQFANSLIQEGSALILWLDSADWCRAETIDAVIDSGLKVAGFSDSVLRHRLTKKVRKRWPHRLLVLLDGVNERSSHDAAQRILAEICASDSQTCRYLFTSRPTNWKLDERNLWTIARTINVQSFTDDELSLALSKLNPSVSREELPDGLLEIARIPRYFQTAVELRSRFKSFSNVSKELVLWAELLRKISLGDPQVTERIGWRSSSDVTRALQRLAKYAGSIVTGLHKETESYSVLQTVFGSNLESVRSDLGEQRIIIDPLGESPAPNRDHVILGFALHLRSVASRHGTETVSELADRLKKELEPIFSQDYLTEALFVALQLSTFAEANSARLSSNARAGLLFSWISSQNSYVEHPRLNFWCSEDLVAFVSFVEEVFVEAVSDSWIDIIIHPLRDLWREKSSDLVFLRTRLEHWLKLVWRQPDLPPNADFMHEGHCLPVARSLEQLRLSLVAIAVLSEGPTEAMIPAVAISWATYSLSTQRRIFGKKPDGVKDDAFDFPVKDVAHNLGVLARWCYTERVKPALLQLRIAQPSDSVLNEGLDRWIESYDTFGWTRCSCPEKELRNQEALFKGTFEECKDRYSDCPELAVRNDLPDLCENDKKIIKHQTEEAFRARLQHFDFSWSIQDLVVDKNLSWYAKYFPIELAELGAKLRLASVSVSAVGPALEFANHLPFADSTSRNGEILEKIKELVSREHIESERRFHWAVLRVHVLAMTSLPETELSEWINYSSERALTRREIHFYPIAVVAPFVLPRSIVALARQEARRFSDEMPDESETSQSAFDYWAWLGGVAGEPDREYHAWVDQEMRSRKISEKRLFYWQVLWFKTVPQDVLEKSLSTGSIFPLWASRGTRAMYLAGREVNDWTKLTVEFDRLVRELPLDLVGIVLLKAGRTSELRRWGGMTFSKALEVAGSPPFERAYWGVTVHTRGDSGEMYEAGCDAGNIQPEESSFQKLHTEGDALLKRLAGSASSAEWEDQANERLRLWKDDREKLQQFDAGALSDFNAIRCLEAWRDDCPERFLDCATRFLSAVSDNSSKAHHVNGFTCAVLEALVPVNPKLAVEKRRTLTEETLHVNVLNRYGVSTFIAALWRSAAAGNMDSRELCMLLINESRNDEDLMLHSITALAEGGATFLARFCEELLSKPLAKDRCVGVSILPWIGDENAINRLKRIVKEDESGWVKAHGEWALEVALQEASCRRFYRNLIQERSRNGLLSGLQVLKPALTPVCALWHRQIEIDTQIYEKAPSEICAVLSLFWYDRKSSLRKTPQLFGRKLDRYLRGEEISHLNSPKPRLDDIIK